MNEPIFSIPPDLNRGEEMYVLPLAGEVNWGMEVFGIAALRRLTDGEGIILGCVDTGIDRTHPAISINVLAAKDFTGSPSGSGDRNGHGTHCSGTIASSDPRIGVAPAAKIVHGKGLSDSGSGGSSGLIDAMQWCAGQGAKVISCSWGSSGEDPAIIRAIRELADKNIWVIAAAGNSGPNTPDVDWPGRSEHCIDVAALAKDLSPASFTSAGAKIDTSGPGVNIVSLKPGGGYATMSGTSMATPFVAGVLGLYRRALELANKPIPTIYQLREALFSRSVDTHTPGDDRRTGPGWINPLLLSLDIIPDPVLKKG